MAVASGYSSPSLLTYLGLGLLQSAQRGPRQNLGANLLDSLGQYGQARSSFEQDQRLRRASELQENLTGAQIAEEERRRRAMERIGGLLSPRTEMGPPEAGDTPEARRQAAMIDYATNIDPKEMWGLLAPVPAPGMKAGDFLHGRSGDRFVNPNTGQIIDIPVNPNEPGTQPTVGLTPLYAQGPGGRVIAIQPTSVGGPGREMTLPEGYNWMIGQTPLRLGDRTQMAPTKAVPGSQIPLMQGIAPEDQPVHRRDVKKAEAIGAKIGEQIAGVEGDIGGLEAIRSSISEIDKGIYTGFYANVAKTFAKAMPGVDKTKAARTEKFLSDIGNVVIPRLKEFGGSDTVEELKYLRQIMAGEITMEEGALREILKSAEAKVQRRIARLNAGGLNGATDSRPPIADFFR